MGKTKSSRGRAPLKAVHGLSPAQECELAEHLRVKLSGREADLLFWAVHDWFTYGPRSATAEAARQAEERRSRSERITDLTRSLLRELRAEAAEEGILAHGVDAPALQAALEQVALVSSRLAPGQRRRPRGAPALEWRDDLVALVRAHYPPEKLTLSRSSHFTTTIELLLAFLGEGVEDLHKQILRTLRRQPVAPFTVRLL